MYIPALSPRARAFDALVQDASEIAGQLDPSGFHPDTQPVILAMGRIAGDLFLPNIRRGFAEVPTSRLGEDGYGVVPLFPGETVVYGDSFLLGTPTRLRVEQEHTPQLSIRELAGLHELFREQGRNHPASQVSLSEPVLGQTAVREQHKSVESAGGTVHLVGRPLILVSATRKQGADVPTMLHEYVHGYDDERDWLTESPTALQDTLGYLWRELRASHIGSVIGHQTGRFPKGETPEQAAGTATEIIEGVRAQWAKETGGAFEPTPALIKRLVEVGYLSPDILEALEQGSGMSTDQNA